MKAYLPFLVVGLTTGAVYALASMGLVLTYTTSGVFNFAHGAVAMFATYFFYTLRVNLGVPTVLAVIAAVGIFAPLLGVVIDRALLRRLEGSPTATFVVASLGLLVALQGLAIVLYGAPARQVEPIFPTSTYHLPGVYVGYDQTIVVAIAIACGIGLAAFFRRTHLGLQMRAVVGDRNLTELVGANASLVTTVSWMLGCSFAALSGVLFAPIVGLDSLLLTLLVVQVFGAAVIGRLRSLPMANVGAYGIAIAAAVATKLVAGSPNLAGVPQSIPFVALFAVLVFSRKGTFAEVTAGQTAKLQAPRFQRVSGIPARGLILLLVVGLVVPTLLNSDRILTATTTLGYILLFISLSLLLGLSRQVSLCHVVFVLFGATMLGHLSGTGLPYLVAFPLAALVLVPVGALLAIPAIRLSGLFLALATFGFGILAQSLLFPALLGREDAVTIVRPHFLQGETAFYYFALAITLLGILAVEVIRVTRLGRVSRALADSPTAVESLAIEPTANRVLIFCLSAFLAALAGGILGTQVGRVSTSSFNPFQSLIWVTVLVAAGTRTMGGSVLAGLMFITVPSVITSATFGEWLPVFFGVSAMILAQTPNGIAGLFRMPDLESARARWEHRLDRRRAAERYESLKWSKAGVP